jgi:hypothetical protein
MRTLEFIRSGSKAHGDSISYEHQFGEQGTLASDVGGHLTAQLLHRSYDLKLSTGPL